MLILKEYTPLFNPFERKKRKKNQKPWTKFRANDLHVQRKSYHNLTSDLYWSRGSQTNSDKFTFSVDSSPQQPGNVYLSLIMVQGELQPEIAELTLSSYRFRPAAWKASNPSPVLLASAQLPAFIRRAAEHPAGAAQEWAFLYDKGDDNRRISGKWLNLFCHALKAGDNFIRIFPGPSTQWAIDL